MAQNLKSSRSDNRGGKREGAGRKPNETKTIFFSRRVTPEYYAELDKLLTKLKQSK